MGTAPSGHAGKRLNLIAAEVGSLARKDKARSAKRSEARVMVRSVAQFVRGSRASRQAAAVLPLAADESPAPPHFQVPIGRQIELRNHFAALIDCSTASLGQQSTLSPADFW